jgi:hypothetical protein
MSAFPTTATKLRTSREVHFVPGADIGQINDRKTNISGC